MFNVTDKYSGDHLKFYSKFIECFLKYLKNYKDYESNQYYIENHYQNATKNENFKLQIFEISWFFRDIFEKVGFLENF